MKIAESVFCNKSSAVLAYAAERFCYPHRVAAEELVIFGRAKVTRNAKLDNKIINNFLSLRLCESALF